MGHQLSDNGREIYLACKKDGWRNVDVFNITNVSDFVSIRYTSHNTKSVKIGISKDFKTAYLSSDSDNILVENGK